MKLIDERLLDDFLSTNDIDALRQALKRGATLTDDTAIHVIDSIGMLVGARNVQNAIGKYIIANGLNDEFIAFLRHL